MTLIFSSKAAFALLCNGELELDGVHCYLYHGNATRRSPDKWVSFMWHPRVRLRVSAEHQWPVGGRKGIVRGGGSQHMAISPDGQWLYFGSPATGGQHVVYRAPAEKPGAVAAYLGEVGKPGNDDAHFNNPYGVACDKDGNLYVSDFGNNRIQVFAPDKKLLRSIPFQSPEQILVHPKTGRIYVLKTPDYTGFRCAVKNVLCALTPDGAVEASLEHLACGDPGGGSGGSPSTICLDASAAEPSVWLLTKESLKRYVDKGKSFELAVDLGKQLADDQAKGILIQTPWQHAYIEVDPVREVLYVRDGGTCGGSRFTKIDGRTGQILERDARQIDEMCYNRYDDTLGVRIGWGQAIVRVNPATGQDVPLEKGAPVEWGRGNMFKGIPIPFMIQVEGGGGRSFQDGFCVAPNGDFYFVLAEPQGGEKFLTYLKDKTGLGAKLQGKNLYISEHLQVYGKDGALKHVSALPGLQFCSGIRVTRAGKVVMALAVQPTAMAAIPDGIVDGPERSDWGTIVQFDSEFDKFPVGRLNGSWEPGGDMPMPAPFQVYNDGSPYQPIPRWVQGARWYYGGVGQMACWPNVCVCPSSRFNMDGFERLWVPAVHSASINVLDQNGNLITRIGRYGNYDSRGPASSVVDPKTGMLRPRRPDDPADLKPPKELSEDIGMVRGTNVAASDEALYVVDIGNGRIIRAKLTYKVEEMVALP